MKQSLNRTLYKFLRKNLGSAGGTISESSIVSLAKAINGRSSFTFETLENQGSTVNPIENRIPYQDAMVVTHIGIRVRNVGAVPGISVPQTYNNATVFPNEVGGFQTDHLAAIWNGGVKFKIGDTTYKPSIPARRSWLVPQTQQSAVGNRSQLSEYDGLIALDSPVVLKGSENNEVTLDIPSDPAQKIQYTDTATNGTVYLEFYALGLRVTGGNKLNFNFVNQAAQ